MSNPADSYLYIDTRDKFLWVEDSEGNQFKVKTGLEFLEDQIKLTDDGYLEVYDTYSDKWIPVVNENDVPVCLKGTDGKDGVDGIDGVIPYILTVSNELDQIYTTDNIALEDQWLTTNIYVTSGGETKKYKTDYTVQILNENDLDISESTVKEDNGDVIVSIPFLKDEVLTAPSYAYTINIIANDRVVCSKIIKALVLNSSVDYDLSIFPSTVIVRSNGVADIDSLYITCTERVIGAGNSSKSIAKSLPEEYSIGISVDDGTEMAWEYGDVYPLSTIPESHVLVRLLYQGQEIDKQQVNILRDGKDGASSYSVILHNELDQLYVTDGVVMYDQTLTTSFQISLGTETEDLKDWTVETAQGSVTDNTLTWVFKTGEEANKTIDLPITFTHKKSGQVITKTFKVVVLNGTKDYDLSISPKGGLHAAADGTLSNANITIEVTERDIQYAGGSARTLTKEEFDVITGLALVTYIDDEEVELPYGASSLSQKVQDSILIELYKDGVLIDSYNIPVAKDGESGSGENSVQLVCTTGNEYTFYLNTSKTALEKDQTKTMSFCIIDGASTVSVETLSVTPPSGTNPGIQISSDVLTWSILHNSTIPYADGRFQYTVSTTYNDKQYSTVITINLVIGAVKFDVTATPGNIHYNPNTSSYNEIVFVVYKTCSGGGYTENTECLATSYEYQIDYSIVGGEAQDTTISKTNSDNRFCLQPASIADHTIKCYSKAGGTLQLQDIMILSCVKDGVDSSQMTDFPINAQIGDIVTWTGETTDFENGKTPSGQVVLTKTAYKDRRYELISIIPTLDVDNGMVEVIDSLQIYLYDITKEWENYLKVSNVNRYYKEDLSPEGITLYKLNYPEQTTGGGVGDTFNQIDQIYDILTSYFRGYLDGNISSGRNSFSRMFVRKSGSYFRMIKWDPNAAPPEGAGQGGERSSTTGNTVTKSVPKLQSLLQSSSFIKDDNSKVDTLSDGYYLVGIVQEKNSYISLYDISEALSYYEKGGGNEVKKYVEQVWVPVEEKYSRFGCSYFTPKFITKKA